MKLVRPVDIDDTNLNSTSVSEDDYAVYAAGTTYNTGDRVILTTGYHKIYESLIDSNTGNNPPDNTIGETPKWLEIGATNAWKMFDNKTNTQTIKTGSIVLEIEPGRVNTIACLNIEANSVTVQMISAAETVYNRTINLQEAVSSSWYEYFFEPITRDTNAIFSDLPIYGDGVITVTIDAGSDNAKCGTFIAGSFKDLGVSLFGINAGVLDYSVKTTDAFGNTTLLKRNNSKTLDIDVFVLPNKINEVYKTLRENLSEVRLWIGSESYDPAIVYGFIREFNEILSSPAGTNLNLTIEGLI